MVAAAAAFETLLSHVADKPIPMAQLGRVLLAKGQGELAHELCARAFAIAPHDLCAVSAGRSSFARAACHGALCASRKALLRNSCCGGEARHRYPITAPPQIVSADWGTHVWCGPVKPT
jgi:hypothetical protein